MKHHLKKIIGLSLIILSVAILFKSQTGFSQDGENPYENQCGEDTCCSSFHLGMDTAQNVWANHLDDLISQEKPASQMVGEGFESLRTLECWMEYTCKAVLYSAIADPDTVEGTGITSVHIDTIPGCQDPENLGFETGWDTFIDYLNTGENNSAYLAQPNQLNFINQCMTDVPGNNTDPELDLAQAWYGECMDLVEKKMGCDLPTEECTSQSSAFVALENALRTASSQQQNRALESKLFDIVNRLSAMQGVANSIKEDLQKLDDLYVCRPGQCT